MPTYIVVHGSVSGKKVGESIELTAEQAEHINASGKMVRGFNEAPTPKERANSGTRVGLDNKTRTVKLDGTVISRDSEPADLEEPAEPELDEEDEAEEPEPEPAPKPAKRNAPKRKGG